MRSLAVNASSFQENRVVVFVHARRRPKGDDAWKEIRLADVFTFHNGKMIRMRAVSDRQQALRWARAPDVRP